MRSEDRKPSKRVFPLLQNLDLDNVTFAQVQGVGDSITIEDMNEQELQDLVLVNLARLVVSGEWTGLLEAGGGFTPSTPDGVTGPRFLLAPIGTMGNTSGLGLPGSIGYIGAVPFVAPTGGLSLTSADTSGGCSIRITTAAASSTILIGVYDADAGSNPQTLLTTVTFDVSSTGQQTNAWSTAVTLDAGSLYYAAYLRPSGETGTVELHSWDSEEIPLLSWRNAIMLANQVYLNTASQTSLPDPFGTPDLWLDSVPCMGVAL